MAANDPEKRIIDETVEDVLANSRKVYPVYPAYLKSGEKVDIVERETKFYLGLTNGECGPFDSIGAAREYLKRYEEERLQRERRGEMSDADWRTAAFLLLDRKFAESPHLHATTNPGGDYEVRCSKCGQVETFSGAGDREVDALTFALYVARQHAHKG